MLLVDRRHAVVPFGYRDLKRQIMLAMIDFVKITIKNCHLSLWQVLYTKILKFQL